MSQTNQYIYVAVRSQVWRGDKEICRAVSSMEARKIARALNALTAREEGRVHD